MEFLQVVLEQGTAEGAKKEHFFLQLLENLHNTAHHKHLSLELFGYGQYTYFFIGCEPSLTKLVEGLIYSTFPNSEIRPMKDYTHFFDPKKQHLVGTRLGFKKSDIYSNWIPFRGFSR